MLLCTLGLAVFAAGCDQGASTTSTMMNLAPKSDWLEEVSQSRIAKDDRFLVDPESPLLSETKATFAGLEYYDLDPAFHFVGKITPYDSPEPFTIITTVGESRPCEKVGYLTFDLGGQTNTLQVYRLLDSRPAPGSPGFFLPFMDATSGGETYPAGRYVELSGPVDGPYVLDFNRAYNPHCAYGAPERFACPVTPADNRLDIRIEAGERGYHRIGD